MRAYPYTIQNGAGEELTFTRRVPGIHSDRAECENRVEPGAGPPMHVHHRQEEGLTVLAGRMGYQIQGDRPRLAEIGEAVVFEPGRAHRFWAAGDSELRCSVYIEPADNIEYFFGSLFQSQQQNGGSRPALRDVAFLATRCRAEFEMLEVRRLIQRILFPWARRRRKADRVVWQVCRCPSVGGLRGARRDDPHSERGMTITSRQNAAA